MPSADVEPIAGFLWITPNERAALEAHVPEVSGIWAAVRFELGGPTPPLTFDEGLDLVMALAGPIRPDGTLAVYMRTAELRSMLGRIQENLAMHPEVDPYRVHQIRCVCARMLDAGGFPPGHGCLR